MWNSQTRTLSQVTSRDVDCAVAFIAKAAVPTAVVSTTYGGTTELAVISGSWDQPLTLQARESMGQGPILEGVVVWYTAQITSGAGCNEGDFCCCPLAFPPVCVASTSVCTMMLGIQCANSNC